jgi:probable F420-dependent oxidoreductase
MELGKLGVWHTWHRGTAATEAIEAAGYGTFWIGGSPSVDQCRPFLEASSSLVIASGILNVWQHEPADVAAARAAVESEFPGRFLLGIGIGHPEATSDYRRPLTTMRAFFDGLDSAESPVPADARCAAALGPKMLDLARDRSLGAHSYFVPVEHTRVARERLGPAALLAPEVAVVVEQDAATARRIAREYAEYYLAASNYTNNLLRLGWSDADIAAGGSDALIDALIPHGSAESVAAAVALQFEAGADHVCLQALGHGDAPVDDYAALARLLL